MLFVGMAGFEPAASTSQMWRDTGLRYIPNGLQRYHLHQLLKMFFCYFFAFIGELPDFKLFLFYIGLMDGFERRKPGQILIEVRSFCIATKATTSSISRI